MNAKSYIGLGLVAVGNFGAGYLVARGVYAKKAQDEIEFQVKAAKAFYKREEYETPQSTREALLEEGKLFEDAAKGLASYQADKEAGFPEDEYDGPEDNRVILDEPQRKLILPDKGNLDQMVKKLEKSGAIKKANIFADPRPAITSLDVESEDEPENEPEDTPDKSRPYLVSQDVFTEPREEYTLAEYTLFAGDNTLADDQDNPLDDAEIDRVIGQENLNHFGHIKDEPHIVLVRNEELMLNIEVTLVGTKFGEKVGGFTPEGDDG
jgi:hypothetical protein